MIIDFHTHTFPDAVAERAVNGLRKKSGMKPFSDGTAEGLRAYSGSVGIGLAVILPVATSPRQVVDINTRAIERNIAEEKRAFAEAESLPEEARSTRLLSFGCIHPGFEDYRQEFARISAAGVPGIKVHPFFQELPLDDPAWLPIFDAAFENDLIVSVHAGDDLGFPGKHMATAAMFRKITDALRGGTLVVAHMGGLGEWQNTVELLSGTGVYTDTSCSTQCVYADTENGAQLPEDAVFLPVEEFEEIVKAFPEGHVLFGTDSPWSDAEEAVSILEGSSLSEDTVKDIFSRSAKALLREHGVVFPDAN